MRKGNDLTDIRFVKALQSNLQTSLDTPQGKEVMAFLDEACMWYESILDPVDKDRMLVNAGKREVLATLKTLMRLTPEQIVALAKQGDRNG